MTLCENCDSEVKRRLHCACGFKVCTVCVVECFNGHCVKCKKCARYADHLPPDAPDWPKQKRVRRRLPPKLTAKRRQELTRELAKVKDGIDKAYWAFVHEKRGKPPALAVPHLYRRRTEIEQALTTGRERKP